MKDTDELNERMDSNDEIIDNLVKKTTELEKQVTKVTELNIPDYSSSLDSIISALNEIQVANRKEQELSLLNAISAKLDKLPKISDRQIRLLLFPETNQGQYYKIVFGRLIPWGIGLVVITYLYSLGAQVIDAYGRQNQQSVHYQRAWLYLQKHAKKKMLNSMDEAYSKTADK